MTMMKTTYGVNVVASNNSWGGGGFDQALKDAIEASNNAGQLISLFRALGDVMTCTLTLYRTEWTATREEGNWSSAGSLINSVEVSNVPGVSFALPIQSRLDFK